MSAKAQAPDLTIALTRPQLMRFPLNFLLIVVDLAGMVALLLWGIHMVQTGVQRTFGAKLRVFLGKALRNRFKGFIAGLGVTTLLQSSTATGLMITGFTAGGLVDLEPALAVMLGANVGTTLIVQVLSFNIAAIAPVLILIGVILFRRGSVGIRDFGRLLIGLGLMLLTLHLIVGLLTPYDDVPSIRALLGTISAYPILDIILAMGITWAAHSSVAIVLVIMSLAASGIIPPEAAFAFVLGANLGTAINPVLESTTKNDLASKRLPIGNLANRLIGVVLGFIALPYISPWLMATISNSARAVADFHTTFNLVVALLFFPFLAPFANLLRKWLPTRIDQTDPGKALYLDPSAQETPAIALGFATREALRMIDVLESMLIGLRKVLEYANRKQIIEVKRLDDILDKLNAAIKTYVISINPEQLSEQDQRRLREILAFVTEIEHSGDIVDNNLLGITTKMVKRGVIFSQSEQAELLAMIDRLIANARITASLFMTGDEQGARMLVSEKVKFRSIEISATDTHFDQLQSGHIENMETSAMYIDALRNLKSINSHLVAATAYPILERNDELLSTRLRQE